VLQFDIFRVLVGVESFLAMATASYRYMDVDDADADTPVNIDEENDDGEQAFGDYTDSSGSHYR